MLVGSHQGQHPPAVPVQTSSNLCFPADPSRLHSVAAGKMGSSGAVPAETGNWMEGGEMVINAR